jgi:hypothetical protein
MIPNIIQNQIESYLDDYKLLPINMMPTKFYSVTFDGWDNPTIAADDPIFTEMVSFAAETARSIINKYKETHALTQPQFFWKPDGSFGIKIGLMELERYEELIRAP